MSNHNKLNRAEGRKIKEVPYLHELQSTSSVTPVTFLELSYRWPLPLVKINVQFLGEVLAEC